MVWASLIVKGPDIWLALTSSASSASMMWGWSSAETRFHGRKVLCKGGGFLIEDLKVIFFMRSRNRFEILQRSRVDFQFATMYRVICMYTIFDRLVLGACRGSIPGVTTEGTRMCAVEQRH